MKFEQYLLTLSTAASRGRLDVVKNVHSQGFPLDAEGQDSKRIPLHWAASRGQVAIAQYLVENSCQKNSIDHQDKEGCTPLILSVLRGGPLGIRLKMINCLLDLGANSLLSDKLGNTALMYMIPIRNSLQVASDPHLADATKTIIEKMKAFAIELAEKNNQCVGFSEYGEVRYYPKPGVEPVKLSVASCATFKTSKKIPDEKNKIPPRKDHSEITDLTLNNRTTSL